MIKPPRGRALWAAAMLLALAACGGDDPPAAAPAPAIALRVVSSAPQLVSGGDMLVEVSVQGDTSPPRLMLNDRDVSTALHADPTRSGVYLGVVDGIDSGSSTLSLSAAGLSKQLSLTAYPAAGPMISGPHQSPFICQTQSFALPDATALGAPLDADCSVTPRVHYLYLAAGKTALAPMPDTTRLPADVTTTTTSQGKTVPFVVRVETRTVDRGIYQSAVLHDPTTEPAPAPWSPPRAWNGRLVAGQGVGCPPGWYIQGNSQGGTDNSGFDARLLSTTRLGSGDAVFSNTLMFGANNCNAALVTEVALMSKERFVKTYGAPAMTVAIGCSGGSYTAVQAADAMPGLYDGVITLCTFVDGLSSSLAGADARLLSHYLTLVNPNGYSAAQRAAITGYKGDGALRAATLNANRIDPVPDRSGDIAGYASAQWSPVVPVGLRYDPVANPSGARPTVFDTARNELGADSASGFALRPYDNVGVQYGLLALNAGTIGIDQFLALNAGVGGLDRDANYTAARSRADLDAITRAEQTGLVTDGGNGLAAIPVIDATGIYDEDGNYHQQWQHFALRERMRQANGDTGNHLMWRGLGNDVPGETAIALMFQWVQATQADSASGTPHEKVVRNRPAAAVDGCFSGSTFIAEAPVFGSAGQTPCSAIVPTWAFPRYAAGGPLANNVMKCTLKAPQASDYAVAFTAAQWQRLLQVFPQGVCDWSQRGVRQARGVAGASVGPSPMNQVFDVLRE